MFCSLVVRVGVFLHVICVVLVLSFIDLWLLSLVYGANECNVRDECMFSEQ